MAVCVVRMWMVLCGIFCASFLCAIGSEEEESKHIGKISIFPTEVDFGEIEHREIKTAKVNIRNYDDSPVRIRAAKSSSDMVFVLLLSGKEIPANTSGTIKVVFAGLSVGDYEENVDLAFEGERVSAESVLVRAKVVEQTHKRMVDARAEARDATRIEIEPQRYDFGEVYAPNKVRFKARVRNLGTKEVRLRARSSCGCVKVELPASVAAGESGIIDVRFETIGRLGMQEQVIRIFTDDYTSPVAKLIVSGKVKADFNWHPRLVSFGTFSRTEEKDATVRITPLEMKELKILGVKFTEPRIMWSLEKILEEKKARYQITIRLPEKVLGIGEIKERMKVRTNAPHYPEIIIPIIGEVQGDLFCVPQTMLFQGKGKEQPLEKVIVVQSEGKSPFRIVRLESSDDRITAKRVSEEDASSQHQIRITLKGEDIRGFIKATLRIHTDVEGESLLEVPIYAYLPK